MPLCCSTQQLSFGFFGQGWIEGRMPYPRYRREQKLSAKLSEKNIEEIRRLRRQGWTQVALAKRFNVCQYTIWRALLSDRQVKELNKGRNKYARREKTPQRHRELMARKAKICGKALKEWFDETRLKYVKSGRRNAVSRKFYRVHRNKICAEKRANWPKIKEKEVARHRRYCRKNKAKINAHQREYRKKNLKRIKAREARYRRRNRDRINAYQRKYGKIWRRKQKK